MELVLGKQYEIVMSSGRRQIFNVVALWNENVRMQSYNLANKEMFLTISEYKGSPDVPENTGDVAHLAGGAS